MDKAQDLCKELYNFINLAPKRLSQFKNLQNELLSTDNEDADYDSSASDNKWIWTQVNTTSETSLYDTSYNTPTLCYKILKRCL